MIIHKSFKFKLLPNKDQISVLTQHGGNLRFTWNKLVEFANEQNKLNGKFPNKKELREKLKTIQQDNEFLKVSHSQPMQDASDKLFDTIINSFKPKIIKQRNQKISIAKQENNNKKLAIALNFGFPKFKRKYLNNDSIFYPQFFKIRNSRIFFPKIGWINYKKHRKLEGKAKFLTIVKEVNNWFVSITCEVNIEEVQRKNIDQSNIVGIDVGLKTFATLSDGTEIQNPRNLNKYLKKLKKEQKILSKRQIIETNEEKFGKKIKKSSNNRNKQILKVQKIHRKIKNTRKDFLHKTSNQIIAKFDGIALETLDIKEMLRKNGRAMNRSISDVSWFEFGKILEYKCLWDNKYFIRIDQFEPSTQKCNQCESIQKLSLGDRIYVCPQCGNTCGRDVNAAMNIRDSGIDKLKNTLATKEIYACGVSSLEETMKQEKLGLQTSQEVCSESQAPAFRRG